MNLGFKWNFVRKTSASIYIVPKCAKYQINLISICFMYSGHHAKQAFQTCQLALFFVTIFLKCLKPDKVDRFNNLTVLIGKLGLYSLIISRWPLNWLSFLYYLNRRKKKDLGIQNEKPFCFNHWKITLIRFLIKLICLRFLKPAI